MSPRGDVLTRLGIYSAIHNIYVVYVKKGGYDYFTFFPDIIALNLKRFLMLNGAILALYFFSGRVPVWDLI